ncbi:hypothetical protein N2152v2_008088 [Parachlorella kessleri]
MAQNGSASSLAEQMQRLQKSMQRREQRRDSDRRDRMARAEYEGGLADVYGEGPSGGGASAGRKRPRNATGGVQWGSAAAAVAAASQLGGPQILRCELCNATFASDALMQQHLEGPAHRKAVERKEAEAQRRQRLGRNYDAAEAAVDEVRVVEQGVCEGCCFSDTICPAAAAWHARQGEAQQSGASQHSAAPHDRHPQELHQASAPQQHLEAHLQPRAGGEQRGGRGGSQRINSHGHQHDQQQHHQQQQWQHRGRGGAHGAHPSKTDAGAGSSAAASTALSHADLLRRARGEDDGPLSIDGWVPPTVLPSAASPEQGYPAATLPGAGNGAAPHQHPAQHQQQQPEQLHEPLQGPQQEQQEEEEGEPGLLAGLVGYGGVSEDEGSSGNSSSSSDGSEQLRHRLSGNGSLPAGALAQVSPTAAAGVGNGVLAAAAVAGLPGQEADQEEESGSDSDEESGGGQPVSFFTL